MRIRTARGRVAAVVALALVTLPACLDGDDDEPAADEPAAVETDEDESADPEVDESDAEDSVSDESVAVEDGSDDSPSGATLPSCPDDYEARDMGGVVHEVERCDTLLRIAAAECDNRGAYLSIFEANEGRQMSGGKTFTDPNIIEVGWLLDIECEYEDAYELAEPDDEPPPTTVPGDEDEDGIVQLETLVSVSIESVGLQTLGNLLEVVPDPIDSIGPIPGPAVSAASLSSPPTSGTVRPAEFGRVSTCVGPALGSSSHAATSSTFGEVADGVVPIEVPANGVFLLKLDASKEAPHTVLIADDQHRTIDVPNFSFASETAHVFQLILTDHDRPGSPPRLDIGEYRYQVQWDDTVAEGVLSVTAPETTIKYHFVSDSLGRVMLWHEQANASVDLAAYRWIEEDCQAAWIGQGVAAFEVTDHWLRVDVTPWGNEKWCLRENRSASSKCPFNVPQG